MKLRYALLWTALFVYVLARLSQPYADTLRGLAIVLLHVVPPALFAVVHGSIVYRAKGMLIFSACCLGIGGLSETLSLRTGFPFGHYYFTDVMGPKPLDLPILIVLAYLGIGYVAWVLSLFFGVPVTNFLGWYLTAYLSYQAFAFYLQANPAKHKTQPPSFWRSAILLYAVCVAGNLLLLKLSTSRLPVTTTLKRFLAMEIFLIGRDPIA